MASGGLKACNTIPGSPASSPEHHHQTSIDGNKQPAHLSWVDLCLDADLFWDLDAVWLQHQPNDGQDISENQPGRPWSRLLEGENQPWHKDGLHPTILLRFEATILCRDVLDQLLFLVPTNLKAIVAISNYLEMISSWLWRYHLLCWTELAVWRSADLSKTFCPQIFHWKADHCSPWNLPARRVRGNLLHSLFFQRALKIKWRYGSLLWTNASQFSWW